MHSCLNSVILKEIKSETEIEHVHLRPSHIQLVQDVFLNTGGSSGCQGHHWHFGELLTQLMQPLVVRTKIVTPLKDLSSKDDSQWLIRKWKGSCKLCIRQKHTWLTQWASSITNRAKRLRSYRFCRAEISLLLALTLGRKKDASNLSKNHNYCQHNSN